MIQLGSGREVPKTFRILYFAAGKMLKMGENGWRSTENCLNPVLRGSMVLAVTLWWFVLGSLVAFAGCVWVTLVILGSVDGGYGGRSLKAVARKMWALPGGPRCGEVL